MRGRSPRACAAASAGGQQHGRATAWEQQACNNMQAAAREQQACAGVRTGANVRTFGR
jgi:hypothetical protein